MRTTASSAETLGAPWDCRSYPSESGSLASVIPSEAFWFSCCLLLASEQWLSAGHRTPPVDSDVDVAGIDIQASEPATDALGSDQRGARAQKNIEDKFTALGHVLERVGDKPDRLHRRMQREILTTVPGHGV